MENIRLNSSISKLKSLHKELQLLSQNISIQNNISYLVEPIEALWEQIDDNLLKIDVLYVSKTKSLSELQEIISEITEADIESLNEQGKVSIETINTIIRVYDENHFPSKNSNTLPSLVKVFLCNPESYQTEDLIYYSQRLAKESILLFIKSDAEIQNKIKLSSKKLAWKTINIKSNEEWTKVKSNLSSISSLANLIGLNLNYSKVCKALETTINNEYKDLNSRKITVHNDHMQLKKLGNSRVGQELYTSLKLNLQRSYSEFENGINNRFEKLTRNKSGTMFTYIMDQIDAITDLEEIKSGGETKYFLSNALLNELKEKTYSAFHEHLSNDIVSLNDYFQVTIEEIDSLFKKEGLLGFDLIANNLSRQEVTKQLEDQFVFEKEYDSKPLKKGMMALFSAIRQPYMMIIMSVGIISQIPDLKELRGKLWPLYILSIVVGLYFALKNGKKKDLEFKKEELKKTQQWLKSEYKRIFSTIEKEWKSLYFEVAKNRFNEILLLAESNLKDFQIARSETLGKETNLTQRKIQKLEAFDKKLNDSKRKKEQIESAIKSVETELKQTFLKLDI
ncbi:hypothetical protein [Tamlana flava]|uniref:hypothetical protein n=1 Tax=Tamlana flava TaxID=3158572 RepID=UPI00351B742C